MRRIAFVVVILFGTVGIIAIRTTYKAKSTLRPTSAPAFTDQGHMSGPKEPPVVDFQPKKVGWVVGQMLGVETPSIAPSNKLIVERAIGR